MMSGLLTGNQILNNIIYILFMKFYRNENKNLAKAKPLKKITGRRSEKLEFTYLIRDDA